MHFDGRDRRASVADAGGSRSSLTRRHPGALELVKVRRGTLALEVGDETVQVKAGHSAWFDASRQHAYRNATTTQVTFTLVVFDSAVNHTTGAV
jgi:quercetin dioxygenase-like cupin family protein